MEPKRCNYGKIWHEYVCIWVGSVHEVKLNPGVGSANSWDYFIGYKSTCVSSCGITLLCKQVVDGGSTQLVQHFRLVHSLIGVLNLKVKCPVIRWDATVHLDTLDP